MVLDVGCAPGAWLQTLFRSNTQRPSFIVGVDMQRVDSRVIQELQVEETNISGGAIYASGGGGGGEGIDTRGIALVQRRLGDNHKEDVQVLTAALRIASGGAVRRFNTILSDLAPKTTGYGDGLASVEAASIAARLATADKYDAYGADNDDDHHHEDDVQGSDADDTSASFQLLVPGGSLCVKVLKISLSLSLSVCLCVCVCVCLCLCVCFCRSDMFRVCVYRMYVVCLLRCWTEERYPEDWRSSSESASKLCSDTRHKPRRAHVRSSTSSHVASRALRDDDAHCRARTRAL